MNKRLGAFRAALLTGWIGLSAAGILYAHAKNIPLWAAVPIIAAFLIEYPFYLVPGFASAREWLVHHFSRTRLAAILFIGAISPYLIYSIPDGEFRWIHFIALCAIAAAVSFWYLVLRPSPIPDTLFLVLLAAIMLSRVLNLIYTSQVVKGIGILGHVMLIHTGAWAALLLRGLEGVGVSFLPNQKEWIVGVEFFFYFLPVGVPLAMWLGVVHLNFTAGVVLWKALAYFFGAFWVVAFSEEFFFRGLLQHWLAGWTGRPWLAITFASLIFGAVHLGFGGKFPNWKMSIIDSCLGCFCGLAFHKTSSIRASMVTHALVVTVWRTLFVS